MLKEDSLSISITAIHSRSAVPLVTTQDQGSGIDEGSAASVDFDVIYREQGGRVLGAIRSVLGPSDEIEDLVARTQAIMTEASLLVTPGFPLRTDSEVVRWPDRYMDPRGSNMWNAVMKTLGNH